MASLTPAKGRWVEIGRGVKVYESEVTQDIIAGTPVPIIGAVAAQSNYPNTPRKQGRETTGLVTPPSSRRKQHSEFTSQSSKAAYHQHACKLKVPDSAGHKLPQLVFRWLVRWRSGAERQLTKF